MKKEINLEKEFKGFKRKNTYINTVTDCISFVELMQQELEKRNSQLLKEIKENKKWKLEVKIRNYFLAFFSEREVDVYEEDTEILNEMISINNDYIKFYNKITRLTNGKNFKELLKLVEFANYYYDNHLDLLEKQREIIGLELRGIHMISPNNGDNRENVQEFLENRLSQLEDKKTTRKQIYNKESVIA